MLLTIAPELIESGLSAAALIARNVDNTRTTPDLIAYRRKASRRLAAHWKNRSISSHPAIEEYHRVHKLFEVTQELPAPEKLINYIRRNKDLTASGAVVDCYNIVSARTLLSIGAHDLASLSLPVTLRVATAQDSFVALGETKPQSLAGEYAYIDSKNSIICRLDVLQCEPTKTTSDSQDIAFFLQGNRHISAATLLKGVWLLAEMLVNFCGANIEIVNFFDCGAAVNSPPLKPQVTFDTFEHLHLIKGTIQKVTNLQDFGDLSSVTIRTDGEIEALGLSTALRGNVVGQEVIVATNLFPLSIGGRSFTAYLPSLQGSTLTSLQVSADIPSGARLY